MDGTYLNESTCLNKLLGLKFTPDLKWNAYIDSVAKDAARMVGSLYRSMRLLTPESLLYLYKSQIRPRMEYCSHIWAGSSRTIISTLNRVQRRMRGLVSETLFASLQSLSHRRNVASLSLFDRYFYGKCWDELHLLVPPVRDLPIRTSLRGVQWGPSTLPENSNPSVQVPLRQLFPQNCSNVEFTSSRVLSTWI